MKSPLGVRTSASHAIRVDWLEAPASVGMTFLPGMKAPSSEGFRWMRDLDADLAALRGMGATALVCLLEDDRELARYGTSELLTRAESVGLKVLRLSIVDGSVPDRVERVDELLDAMEAHEKEGGKLVIHCRGGLGRTGTIAGCYLVRRGCSPAEALDIVRRVRQTLRCPENAAQEAFIAKYAQHWAHSPAGVERASALPPPPQSTPSHRSAPALAAPWYATALAGLRAVEHAVARRSSHGDAGQLLASIEHEVAAAPERCFGFAADGSATLVASGHSFAAGRFATPQIGELRARVAGRARRAPTDGAAASTGRFLLSVLHGAHPLGDIGTLQATAAPRTLFQVASQFNCLEAPGPRLVPVREYVHDFTQGPRASVSAFPGTFLRHYRAPAADGTRFVQTDARCIDLLADAVPASVAEVRGGYLQTANVRDMAALASALEANFDKIRIGAHADVEVVFGHDWNGAVPADAPRIAQAFTSTMALGSYGRDDGAPALALARRQLLRAAYAGTLLAALDLDCDAVVLTMIGGGVFGNPLRDIWDAIHWALANVEPLAVGTKQVLVNTREDVADVDREKVRDRGGVVVELAQRGVEVLFQP